MAVLFSFSLKKQVIFTCMISRIFLIDMKHNGPGGVAGVVGERRSLGSSTYKMKFESLMNNTLTKTLH